MSSVIKAGFLGDFCDQGVFIIAPGVIVRHPVEEDMEHAISPDEEARAIIDQATAEAEAMIASARQESESIRSAAYQEGYDAGFTELEDERAALAEKISGIQQDMEVRLDQSWTAMETEVLKLSVTIAKQIVRKQISENQGFVLDTIKIGLRQLKERQELKIRVSPDDYECVRSHKEDIASSVDGVRSLEIIDDRRIDSGGCLIETTNGDLDARMETQFNEVERALLDAAHDGRNDITAEAA